MSHQESTMSEYSIIPTAQTAVMVAGPNYQTPLGELVQAAVTAAGRSSHTRRAYQTSIGQFLQYMSGVLDTARPLAESGQDGRRTVWTYRGTAEVLRHVMPSHIDGFRSWLDAGGAATNALEARYAAVKTFLAVCYRDGYLSNEQAQRMNVRPFKQRQRRDEKPTGRRLTKAEVKKLRGAATGDRLKDRRDRAILDCMLYAGLRRSEVAGLTVGNLQSDGGRYWLIVTGKGQKTRRVKVADPLYKSLVTWIDGAGKTLATGAAIFDGVDRHGRLTGKPVNGSTVGRLVAEFGAAAGIAAVSGNNQLSPHDLRRTAARNAHDNGAPLLLIQNFLGHSDPKTTARYIGLDEDDSNTATDFIRY
jgi:integrase